MDFAVKARVQNGQTARGLMAMVFAASMALPNLLAGQETESATGPVPLRIAAGPVSEPMFTAAGIIANIISNPPGGPPCPADAVCGPPGLVGEARSTPSSIANLESLAQGESETAFVEGDLLWQAHNGFGRFAGRPLGDLRALSVLYTKTVFLIVRAGGPISDITDLRRKTVALGVLDDPHFSTISAVLTQHGVRERDLTLVHLGLDSAATALAHGDVDAAIVVAPALPQGFRDVAERTPLRLLPIEAKAAQALLRQQPYLIETEIGDLAEGRRRTSGLALPVLWVTSQRLPAQIGYGLVRSLQAPSNKEAVAQALPSSSAVADKEELTRAPIPLHIGAARWAEEASGVVR
jgi:TRAP transporter TAXI family solute receptor